MIRNEDLKIPENFTVKLVRLLRVTLFSAPTKITILLQMVEKLWNVSICSQFLGAFGKFVNEWG